MKLEKLKNDRFKNFEPMPTSMLKNIHGGATLQDPKCTGGGFMLFDVESDGKGHTRNVYSTWSSDVSRSGIIQRYDTAIKYGSWY